MIESQPHNLHGSLFQNCLLRYSLLGQLFWLCLKHTTTVEHSLISTGGRDGLGMRLHRQVATTIADLR